MFRWIVSFFGLEPIQPPLPLNSKAPGCPRTENSIEEKNWPEGPQVRKAIRFFEPDGWAHSNWSWRSSGYIDRLGSLYPKVDKAECRHCLGVLVCQTCGKTVRPSTKTADMNAQLARNCPECANELRWITCKARTYRFVIEEGGSQYSIWEHTGSHHSHPRPPPGRRPARSVPVPPTVRKQKDPQTTCQNANKGRRNTTRAHTIENPPSTAAMAPPPALTLRATTKPAPAFSKSIVRAATKVLAPGSSTTMESTGPGDASGDVGWKDEK